MLFALEDPRQAISESILGVIRDDVFVQECIRLAMENNRRFEEENPLDAEPDPLARPLAQTVDEAIKSVSDEAAKFELMSAGHKYHLDLSMNDPVTGKAFGFPFSERESDLDFKHPGNSPHPVELVINPYFTAYGVEQPPLPSHSDLCTHTGEQYVEEYGDGGIRHRAEVWLVRLRQQLRTRQEVWAMSMTSRS